jgi:aminoglycoside 3-N-acetyltransferase I
VDQRVPFDVVRLGPKDREAAKRLFCLMAEIFGEEHAELSDAHVGGLLARPEFWALAAVARGELLGGLTAHTLPMTKSASHEIFIYDLAVREDRRRAGVGRRLVTHLADAAAASGIRTVFVPVDDEDAGALHFYRALGGVPSAVTIYTFARPARSP